MCKYEVSCTKTTVELCVVSSNRWQHGRKLQEGNLAPKVRGRDDETSTEEWPRQSKVRPSGKNVSAWGRRPLPRTKGQHCRSKCASSQGRIGYGRWSGTPYRGRKRKTRRITGRSGTRQTSGQLCDTSSKRDERRSRKDARQRRRPAK